MFKSLINPRKPDDDDNDIELGNGSIPLFSSHETSSSVHNNPHPSSRFNVNFLGSGSGNGGGGGFRSTSPKPATLRNTTSSFIPTRKSCRQFPSWQNTLIGILTIYFLLTVLRRSSDGGGALLSGPARIAEYGGGEPRSDLTHMVMVAGHAIWMGGQTMGVNEDEWYGFLYFRLLILLGEKRSRVLYGIWHVANMLTFPFQ